MALWNERQAREKQARSPKCEESGMVGVWQVMVSTFAKDIEPLKIPKHINNFASLFDTDLSYIAAFALGLNIP